MIMKQLLSKLSKPLKEKYLKAFEKARQNNVAGYSLLNHEVYYNQATSKFYFKIVTDTGFICTDITIEDLFLKSHILNGLDRSSCNYVHYVRGRLEERANLGDTSIFTLNGVCPFETGVIIVKSLVDGSIHKWNIAEAYTKQWYFNLDKPSIGKFIEQYFILKMLTDITIPEQIKLRLVK